MSTEKTPSMFGLKDVPALWWMGMKRAWSPSYRQEFYEKSAEAIILWAYESASSLDKFGHHHPGLFAVIDDIMDFKDDPKSVNWSAENTTYLHELGERRKEAAQAYMREQPEQLVERLITSVSEIYGLSQLDDDAVKSHAVWRELWDASVKLRQESLARRGLSIMEYAIGYEWRVEMHQLFIQAVKQMALEGSIDSTKLFLQGGTHESVARDVEAFDRLLYAEWESGLKHMSEKEKRVEFREFLAHRQKIWGQEYSRWLKSR